MKLIIILLFYLLSSSALIAEEKNSTILFEKDSIWWLLTNSRDDGMDPSNELNIFYSKDKDSFEFFSQQDNFSVEGVKVDIQNR